MRTFQIIAVIALTLAPISAVQSAVITHLTGQVLPDTNPNPNGAAPVDVWDLYVPINYYGDGTGETPITSNYHGFDNFLGPSDSVTIGTVTFHPQSGTDRGYNAVRAITGDPALKTGNTGQAGPTLIHYEPLSSLGRTYGFFMNKNNSGEHGTSQAALGDWSDFKMNLGSAPATSHQITVSSRFKIDYANDGTGTGNGILSLVTPGNEALILSIKDFASTDAHYGLEIYKENKVDPPILVADVENINGDPSQPTASVHTSPGYYSVQMSSDSTTHLAVVSINDEFSSVVHNYIIDITDPYMLTNPAINGSVAFGAGLDLFKDNNSELKMVFDDVQVSTGVLPVPEPSTFVLAVLGLAITVGCSLRRRRARKV